MERSPRRFFSASWVVMMTIEGLENSKNVGIIVYCAVRTAPKKKVSNSFAYLRTLDRGLNAWVNMGE